MVESARELHQHREGSDKQVKSLEHAGAEKFQTESHQEGLGTSRMEHSAAASAALQDKGVVGNLSLHDSRNDGSKSEQSPPASANNPSSDKPGRRGSDLGKHFGDHVTPNSVPKPEQSSSGSVSPDKYEIPKHGGSANGNHGTENHQKESFWK